VLTHPDLARALGASSTGSPGFVADRALWSQAQWEASEEVLARVDELGLEVIRVGFADPHGIVRSKSLSPRALRTALANGLDFSLGPFLFDTGLDLAFDPFSPGGGVGLPAMEGASDFLAVPDPLTFKVLPWADGTGWILADEYFKDGTPVPFSGRALLRRLLAGLAARDLTMIVGLEVEWYLARLNSEPGPEAVGGFGRPGQPLAVAPVNAGYQFNSETYGDALEGVLRPLRHHLTQLGLPLRSTEHESGPGQMEFTFEPLEALQAADAMVLFRTATKQVCRRLGHHATFMCQPALPGFDASGWHLHQSLYEASTAVNAFMATAPGQPVSPLARHYAGGLIANAPAACLFTTPTINGYRRFDSDHSLAPSRAGWSEDSRGAMVRVLAAPLDPSSHFENRIGEPAANPYFYIASQLMSGLDGIDRRLDPGALRRQAGEEEGPALPVSLAEAATALERSPLFRAQAGDALVEYLVALKRHEIGRFEAAPAGEETVNGVTAWEQREYFNVY
jgi:glutamine synthetase